ncbi:MAG: DNA polymerase III subunit gamma/tau [Erysipelotrichaceae bacterium]|nr:DNA polymerase III subunit gamma/tau [Erysipelotrichaceae bacterium]
MAYKALYRKYRPKNFEEVVGQDYIIKTLKHAIEENKIAHAYLFCGTRGTGKTSVAKIFAKSVNCLSDIKPCNKCENCIQSDEGVNPDIIEMDAASNNGVDEIRDIIENLKYSPINSKYKVYIIDEVHMLSKGAFNALLKTLEEPPEYVIFILATTEPHKVLPTIISRCQRYDFLKVEKEFIIKRIEIIAEKENIEINEEAKNLISTLASGGMRDALSILDQCVAYSNGIITGDDVKILYGLTTVEDKFNIILDIANKNTKKLLETLKEMNIRGVDFKKLGSELIEIFKETIIYAYSNDKNLLRFIDEDIAKKILSLYNSDELLSMIDILMKTSESYVNAVNVYNYFEVACLKLLSIKNSLEVANKSKEEKPIIKQEEIIHEETKVDLSNKQLVFDDETILQLLVQCDKENKKQDTYLFSMLNNYRFEMESAKYVNILNKTKVFASGKDCVIVTGSIESIINNLNDTSMNIELYEFIKNKLNIDKMIYGISDLQQQRVSELFMSRKKENTLPNPLLIKKHIIEKKEDESDLEKLYDLFGKENIEIIEEEK